MAWNKGQNPEWDRLIPPKWRDAALNLPPLSGTLNDKAKFDQSANPFNNVRNPRQPGGVDPQASLRDAPQAKPDTKPVHEQNKPDAEAQKLAAAVKASEKPAAEVKPAPRPSLKAAFTPLAVAAPATKSEKTNNADNPATGYRQGDEFKMGTKNREALTKRRQEDQEDREDKRDNGEEFSNAMEQWAHQQEEQQRFNQYLDEMIEYTTRRTRELELKEREIQSRIEWREQLDAKLAKELLQIDEGLANVAVRLGIVEKDISETKTEIAGTQTIIAEKTEAAAQTDAQLLATREEERKLAEQKAQAQKKKADAERDAENKRTQGHIDNSDVREGRRFAANDAARLAKAKAELLEARTKTLKDPQGRDVSKNEKGQYFTTDPAGNRLVYNDEDQKALREKQEKGSLLTADQIKEKEQAVQTAEQAAAGTTGKVKDDERKMNTSYDEEAAARRLAEGYGEVISDLDRKIIEKRESINALTVERKKLEQEIRENQTKLTDLQTKLDGKLGDQEKLLKEKADLEKLQKTKLEERTANIEAMTKDRDELRIISADKTNLTNITDAYKRMKDLPPGPERDKIEKEIKDMKAAMSPDDRARFEKHEQEAQTRMKSSSPSATASAPPPTQTTKTSATENTSRANGTAAATIADEGRISTAVTPQNQFKAAAAGIPASDPQEEIFIATRVAAPATSAARPG